MPMSLYTSIVYHDMKSAGKIRFGVKRSILNNLMLYLEILVQKEHHVLYVQKFAPNLTELYMIDYHIICVSFLMNNSWICISLQFTNLITITVLPITRVPPFLLWHCAQQVIEKECKRKMTLHAFKEAVFLILMHYDCLYINI